MTRNTDLYELLGVPKTATHDEVKKAYKKLAIKLHPDKNTGDDKAEKEAQFVAISEAYAVLSDPDKRKRYDMHGTYDESPQADLSKMFNDMFFNMAGPGFFMNPHGPHMQQNPAHHPAQDTIEIKVTIDEVWKGASKKVDFDILDKCDVCNGIGVKDPNDIIKCMNCGGAGNLSQQVGPFMMQQMCPSCGGHGKEIKQGKHCGGCKGSKVAYFNRAFDLRIPQGVPNRHRYRMENKGSYDLNSGRNNDLILIFVHDVDPRYKIDYQKNAVHIEENLNIDELLCGFSKTISVYGEPLHIYSNHYFNPTNEVRIENKGLPVFKKKEYGDLFIKFNILHPEESESKLVKYHNVFVTMFKPKHAPKDNVTEHSVLIK